MQHKTLSTQLTLSKSSYSFAYRDAPFDSAPPASLHSLCRRTKPSTPVGAVAQFYEHARCREPGVRSRTPLGSPIPGDEV